MPKTDFYTKKVNKKFKKPHNYRKKKNPE